MQLKINESTKIFSHGPAENDEKVWKYKLVW